MNHEIEIVDCKDRHCSLERRESNNQDSVYIPGAPVRPAENVAMATFATVVVPTEPAITRSSLLPEMPAMTASPG
jgi:hypothetical protein